MYIEIVSSPKFLTKERHTGPKDVRTRYLEETAGFTAGKWKSKQQSALEEKALIAAKKASQHKISKPSEKLTRNNKTMNAHKKEKYEKPKIDPLEEGMQKYLLKLFDFKNDLFKMYVIQ